ncbi:STAS domain-containing protein [Nevskia sp.]|uniref:STAS domain-containing protein n=1 Tax=Nevskia sp. TaxID=1929292 RepID=UPI0025F00B83|nr:STAS domain-containing protein [Nevskia sp.]
MNESRESSPKPAKRSRRKAAVANEVPAMLSIPADAGIDETGNLRSMLAACLDDTRVTLDGSQVQRIHTSAMQLFLMFFRDRKSAGRTTVWHEPSAPLHAAARVLGLNSTLELARELS